MEKQLDFIKSENAVERTLFRISMVMVGVASVFLALMMVLTSVDVAGRYLFNRPLKGAYELIGLMMICASSWGMSYCQFNKDHIRIRFVFDRLSPATRNVLSILNYILGLAGIGLIVWQLMVYSVQYFHHSKTEVTETLGLPLYPFTLMLAIGMLFLAVTLLLDLIKSAGRLKSFRIATMSIVFLAVLGMIGWLLFFFLEIDRSVIGLISIALMLGLLFLGIPVGYVLIICGLIGFAQITSIGPAVVNIALVSFETANSFEFAVIPLFLLMSAFISGSGIGSEAYRAARAWIGHLRGGLAMATIGACGLFAACTGSSFACAVAMGKVSYPEMKKQRYDDALAVGTIAAGGTLGILIPPSMGFVLIGILTEVSIGKLFIAGIIPGILEMLIYIATIHYLCRAKPSLGPRAPRESMKNKIVSLRLVWPIGLLFVFIMGGIYAGIFTPTEAGGVGALGALIIGRLRGKLDRAAIQYALADTAKTAAMIILMVAGAFIFMRYMAITRIPFTATEFLLDLGLSKYVILTFVIIIYIVLGMFFDIFSMLILTVPLLFPMVTSLGFNPIWYGVIMVKVAEIGCITPPIGINIFGLATSIDVPMSRMYRGIMPFFVADIVHVLLLIAFPSIILFLPGLM